MALPALASVLGDHARFFSEGPNGRLHCRLTGIDVLPDADSVVAHVHSKRYLAAKVEADLQQFGPYIISNPEDPSKLLCTLTGALINKNEEAVWRHMMGNKFQRLLNEKEAARAAAKANRSTAAPQAPPTAPETDALPEVSDDGVDATSSSDDEGAGEEGGFWVPPPGARRDEDREEELAQEDVAMTDAEVAAEVPLVSNGHGKSEHLEDGRARKPGKQGKHKGKALNGREKRATKSIGPAENAPQKKKRRPPG